MRNILDIQVSDIQKHTTRIEWIDNLFGSLEEPGITKGTSILISGTPGSGKSTLIRQVADLLKANNDVPFYNSTEQKIDLIIPLIKKHNLTHGFMAADHRKVSDIISDIEQNPEINVVIIDSISKIQSTPEIKNPTLHIIDYCKDHNKTLIMICHTTKQGKIAGLNKDVHEADVHLHVYVDLIKASPTNGLRIIEMIKNRYGDTGVKQVYDIDANGIIYRGSKERLDQVNFLKNKVQSFATNTAGRLLRRGVDNIVFGAIFGKKKKK